MTTVRRALTIFSLLLASLWASPTRASENLPNVPLGPEVKKRIETYRKASDHTLKSILTPMVGVTAKGREHLGARWQAESGRMVALLKGFRQAGVIDADNPQLKRWYDDELDAWTSVRKIGSELIDFHYRLGLTLLEIEKDVKDSRAYYARLKGILGKTNDHAGNLGDAMSTASQAIENAKPLGPAADKITWTLAALSDNSQTVARLIRQFHIRQLEFIKDRGKLNAHKETLSRLKAKHIDPNQNGTFFEHEKSWEAAMTKTYESYVKALDAWKKENRWHDGKEQLYAMFKSVVNNLGGIPLKFLTVGMPQFMPDNALQLDAHIMVLRGTITKAIKKYRGEVWAEIEEGLQTAEQERQDLREVFETKLDQVEDEAGRRAASARERYEKVTRPLKSEYNRLVALAAREDDENTMKTLARQMKGIREKLESAERTLEKMRHLHLEVWRGEQEEIAFKELRAGIEKIDERVKELNQAKRNLD